MTIGFQETSPCRQAGLPLLAPAGDSGGVCSSASRARCSPAEDVGEPEVSQRFWPLAAVRVPVEPGIACTGDLVVAAGHLRFEDPRLFESARALLDGANRPRQAPSGRWDPAP